MRGAKSRLPGGPKRAGNAGIGRIKDAGRRARKNNRLLAGHKRRDLVVLLVPRLDAIPAQAVIQREAAIDAPAILAVKTGVFVAAVEGLKLALVVLAWHSQQEIREIRSGFGAEEKKATVELRDGIDVDLIVVKFAAEFQRVRADHLRKIVEPLECVSNLMQLVGVGADREAVEADTFDAFGFWRERDDARRAGAGDEALRREARADAADGFTEVVRIAQEAEAEFVDGAAAKIFGVTEAQQLSAAEIVGAEAGHVRAALRDGIRIVLRPVVEEIVGGKKSAARVCVETIGAFVIAQREIRG